MRTKTENLEESRQRDFLAIVRRNCVWLIEKRFNGDVSAFIHAPSKYKNMQISKKYSGKVYENIRNFNLCALDYRDTADVFGRDSDKKWLNHSQLIDDLVKSGKLCKINHGNLVYKSENHFHANIYYLPCEELKQIFSNDDLKTQILDACSSIYTNRQKRLIKKIFMRKTEDKKMETTMKPRKQKKTTTIVPTDDIPESEAPRDVHREMLDYFKKWIQKNGLDFSTFHQTKLSALLNSDDISELKKYWNQNCYIDAPDKQKKIVNFVYSYTLWKKLNGEWKTALSSNDTLNAELDECLQKRFNGAFATLDSETRSKLKDYVAGI